MLGSNIPSSRGIRIALLGNDYIAVCSPAIRRLLGK
eukprot:COSAG05_NODE_12426_length_468_cov_1.073171_1_plen_35_part_10